MKKHDVPKYFYEYFAKLILESYFSEISIKFELSDRPDLTYGIKGGVEVTRTFLGNEAYAAGIFKHIQRKPLSEVSISDLERLHRLGYKEFVYNNLIYGYYPIKGVWITTDELKKAFTEKLRKINEYETEHTHLFIFLPCFNLYERSDMDEFLLWAIEAQKGHAKQYELVFLYQETQMYICNLMDATVTEKILDELTVHNCCVQAEEYVKKPSK